MQLTNRPDPETIGRFIQRNARSRAQIYRREPQKKQPKNALETAIKMIIDICDLHGHILASGSFAISAPDKGHQSIAETVSARRVSMAAKLTRHLVPGQFRIHVNKRVTL